MKSGNAGWTGFSPDPRVKPPFRLKWASQPGQPACVTVADGKVFGRAFCMDAETGDLLRRGNTGSNTPSFHKGRLYTGGGGIRVADAVTGKGVWSKRGYLCNRTYKTAVTVCDGAVYAGCIKDHEGKKFYFAEAVDAATGKKIWSTPLIPAEGPIPRGNVLGVAMSNAGVGGGRVFLSTHHPKMIFALDQKTGKELWRKESVVARHALSTDGETVWAAECAHGVTALDAKTGKERWHWGGYNISSAKAHYKHLGTADHPPTAAYGKLFVSCYGREYTVLDAASGKKLLVIGDKECNMWSGGCGPLTAAAGWIYSNCLQGKDFNGRRLRKELYVVDPNTGKPVWRCPLGSHSCCRVAIAYGRIYAVTRNEICCFEPVPPDYKNEPQPAPSEPAGPLEALARPFDGKPGEEAAGGKPKGGTDWPMYGGCPARCGLDLSIGLPIKEAWKFQTGGKVKSSPVIADGMTFAGSNSGELFALDLASGAKKWSAKIGSWVWCSPAVANGIVVCGADDGVLRAFDAKSGKAKWQFKTAGAVRAAPAIVGERIVFGSWDGRCYCLRLSDGKEFWRYKVGEPGVRVYAPPAVANGRVYVGAWENWVIHALDLGTGKPLDGYDKSGPYRASKSSRLGLVQGLAVYRGITATGSAHGSDKLLDAATGKILGRAALSSSMRSSNVTGAPAFSSGKVFTYRNNLGARLLDVISAPKASRKKMKYPPGYRFKHMVLNTPLATRDLLIAATISGTLEVRKLPDEKSNGAAELAWEWKSPSGAEIWTAPAAGSGFIVLGSDDGHVYAFAYSKAGSGNETGAVNKVRVADQGTTAVPAAMNSEETTARLLAETGGNTVRMKGKTGKKEGKAKKPDLPSLYLLKKYPHKGTKGDTYSEGLDFYNGYLWHTTKTGLTKLDPENNFGVLETWRFTHQSHTESAVWFKEKLYNFTYQIKKKKDNSIFILTLNDENYKAEKAGNGLGVTNWGSCRNNSPLKPGTETAIIYTAEGRGFDNQLLWYDPVKKETIKKLKIKGILRIEDLGMDRYGTVWASSYKRGMRNRIFRISLKQGAVIQKFAGPEGLKSRIIDGIAVRSLKDHDVMYVTGKYSKYIYEYQVPELPEKEKNDKKDT